MILSKKGFFKTSKLSDISAKIKKFKNLKDSKVLSCDFQAIKTSPVASAT
jgi:hypothetical protein